MFTTTRSTNRTAPRRGRQLAAGAALGVLSLALGTAQASAGTGEDLPVLPDAPTEVVFEFPAVPTIPELPCSPSAGDDEYTVLGDTTTAMPAGTLLVNDVDCGWPVRLMVFTDHGHVVSHDGPGGFAYTPDPGYVGDDSFSYDLMSGDTDEAIVLASATVTLHVLPFDGLPELPEIPEIPIEEIPGLPEIPELPELPQLPEIPVDEIPELPELPQLPEIPVDEIPQLPELPQLPQIPTEPTTPTEDTTPTTPTEPTTPTSAAPTTTVATTTPGELPRTGSDSTMLVAMIGLGCLAAGVTCWRAAARRPSTMA